VCVFKICAADEPSVCYLGFDAAQAFHAMFSRVCELRRAALLNLVRQHTAVPGAEAAAGKVPNTAAGAGAEAAAEAAAAADARAWLEPRVLAGRSAFASFGLTAAQWFGFGVALVQRRLEKLPGVPDLAVLPKRSSPAAAAAAAAALVPAAAAAAVDAASTSSSARADSGADAAAARRTAPLAALWPPRYRCRFVRPSAEAVLAAVRALAARDARVKPNPAGCARAESRSNIASATARAKRVTRELHSGGGEGEGSAGGSGSSSSAARKGARAKTAGGSEHDDRGSRSGLHVKTDAAADEVGSCPPRTRLPSFLPTMLVCHFFF
jgi:hypothetical protein